MPSRYPDRVLVVDDSPTNLLVATAMLNDRGLDVDTAMSAAQAVKRAGEVDYALILMDLSLPDASGLEAAREIRAIGGHNREIPIVALTGQCLPRDRRACCEAGMNDFISKPIDLRVLGTVLHRWCGVPLFAERDAVAVALPIGSGIDRGIFAQLRADVTPISLRLLISRFVVEAEEATQRMESALSRGDHRALGEHAHRLKSAAALFGATNLSRAVADLENAIAQGGGAGAILGIVVARSAEACAALRAAIEEQPVSAGSQSPTPDTGRSS